jgi:sulfoxide reductase catalytic subunit YedY
MTVRRKRDWALPDSAATPEPVYLNRRRLLAALGLGTAILAAPALVRGPGQEQPADAAGPVEQPDPTASLYPVPRNTRYVLDRGLTDEHFPTTYNNFYEFGSHKSIHEAAQKLPIRPWQVVIDGLIEKPISIDVDTLIRRMPLEERVYRHRCVEAWSMAVPWSGFPMAALVAFARPLSSARYVRMETFLNSEVAAGQRQAWYPWPYVEGLTMAEATNELAFIVTGLYGKPLLKQNGAPLRLAVPWKYGFKSTKSIVRFSFTDQRPMSFWEALQPEEYGFWANVNPAVPHRRWSQATERVLGTEERRPTLLFNGYGDFVAELYKGLESEQLYA